jgi:hypothetical protein
MTLIKHKAEQKEIIKEQSPHLELDVDSTKPESNFPIGFADRVKAARLRKMNKGDGNENNG